MGRAAKKTKPEEAPTVPQPEPAKPAPSGNVVDLPVTPEKFGQAFEVYMDARAERDRQDERMEQFKPIIITYVKANGSHEKPMRPDDAKMEYSGFGVHHQFNPRWHDAPGVAWIKRQIEALPPDNPQRQEYERALVPTIVLNRELWEALLERPNSPVPQEIADKVIPISYKLVVRDLAKKTCTKCGTAVHKSDCFCRKCGSTLAEQFDSAHKAKA